MTVRANLLATLVTLTISMQLVTVCIAQTKSEAITVVSHVDIIPDAYKPESEENAARLLRSEVAATQHDAGLISYVVLKENGLTNDFTIVETWHDARSYQVHEGSDHTIKFRTEIQPFPGSPFDSRENYMLR